MEALQKANTSLEEVKENHQEDDNDVDGNDDQMVDEVIKPTSRVSQRNELLDRG